jgi:hypothetical protein
MPSLFYPFPAYKVNEVIERRLVVLWDFLNLDESQSNFNVAVEPPPIHARFGAIFGYCPATPVVFDSSTVNRSDVVDFRFGAIAHHQKEAPGYSRRYRKRQHLHF